jgi:hypothetical protein
MPPQQVWFRSGRLREGKVSVAQPRDDHEHQTPRHRDGRIIASANRSNRRQSCPPAGHPPTGATSCRCKTTQRLSGVVRRAAHDRHPQPLTASGHGVTTRPLGGRTRRDSAPTSEKRHARGPCPCRNGFRHAPTPGCSRSFPRFPKTARCRTGLRVAAWHGIPRRWFRCRVVGWYRLLSRFVA